MSSTTHRIFHLILMIYHITANTDDFFCWSESERASLKFINNNNPIHHFPTIRLIQGYWDSQWALQYVSYLYLKEKMGLEVEFFPSLSSGDDLSLFPDYPEFYWRLIEEDSYDLLLEMWPQPNKTQYYDKGTVIYGGINDIYGQIGQFVPDYVYDELMEGTLPQQLKHNTALRQQYIEAYTTKSGRDWVKYLNETLYNSTNKTSTSLNGTLLGEYLDYGYPLPTYDTPIMWGSAMSYTQSLYTQNITEHFDIHNDSTKGLDWIFCPLLSESVLSEFVIDLYERKQPFIANIYTPHPDFATISNRTEEYMRFEHIFIHSNIDNSRDANCYSTAQCKEPIAPLFKLGNPLLADSVPEILNFLYDFSLLVDELNDIIYYRKALDDVFDDTQMSSHHKWLNATCKWLKENADITMRFHQNIIRYDCLDGCGFNYSYQGDDGEELTIYNIGGYCANSSSASQCICTNAYLSGDKCRTHCDGLLGPYYDALNETFYFYQCNRHGTCDISKQQCTCVAGYSGTGCSLKFTQFEYDSGLQALFLTLFLLCILILIVSVVWLWMNQKYKTVKALSAKMTTLFSLGLTFLCIGTILYLYHPLSNTSCNMRNYCYGLGAILTIMAPLCKTYRVTIIFAQARNMKRIEIPDKKLLGYLIWAVVIEFCICAVYHILHQVNGGVGRRYLEEYNRIESVCNQSQPVQYIEAANYLYIFTLIVILCFFSFKNRQSHKLFKESKCAYFGSFFSLFVFIVVVVFNTVTRDRSVIISIQASAMLIALSVIWTLFYGVRIYKFGRYPEKRSVVDLSQVRPNRNSQNPGGSMQVTGVSPVPPDAVDASLQGTNRHDLKRPSSGYYSGSLNKQASMDLTATSVGSKKHTLELTKLEDADENYSQSGQQQGFTNC